MSRSAKNNRIIKLMREEERVIPEKAKQTLRRMHKFEAKELQAPVGVTLKPRPRPKTTVVTTSSGSDAKSSTRVLAPANYLEKQDSAANGFSIIPGTLRKPNIYTGDPTVDAMISGVCTKEDPRFSDRYTMIETAVTTVSYANYYPLTNASTLNANMFGFALYFNGSPKNTVVRCTVSSAGAITYPTTPDYAYHCGIDNADMSSRPIGVALRLQPILMGLTHPMVMCALPLLPTTWGDMGAYTGLPTNITNYPSAAQVTAGARVWLVQPGQFLNLCTSPMDSRSFDFYYSSSERGQYSATHATSWGGWLVWGYTLSNVANMDQMSWATSYTEEVILEPTAQVYPYVRSIPHCDTRMMDASINLFDKLKASGYTAYKLTEGVSPDVNVFKGFPTVSKTDALGIHESLKEVTQRWSATYKLPAPSEALAQSASSASRSSSSSRTIDDESKNATVQLRKACDEDKIDEAPIILTPTSARRPSLATPLTSRSRQPAKV